MTIDEIRLAIQKDIKETQEYEDFIKVNIKPLLKSVGRSHMDHLHFFNLGYQFAMEKIDQLLREVNE